MCFFCNNLRMKVKILLKICYVEICKLFLVAFFSLFFLLPGIFCFVDLAYTPIIAKKSPHLDLRGIFGLSKELSQGNRREIILQIIKFVIFAVVMMSASFLIVGVFGFFVRVTKLTYLLATLSCGLFFVIFYCFSEYFVWLERNIFQNIKCKT